MLRDSLTCAEDAMVSVPVCVRAGGWKMGERSQQAR